MGARARTEGKLAALGLALAASLRAGALFAQTPQFTLDWRAPAECPGEGELAARVGQLRGDHDTRANPATLDVRAFVTRLLDGRFRVELRLVQSGGERVRVLEAPTCTGLAEASAVVIALAMSPAAKRSETESTPTPTVKPPTARMTPFTPPAPSSERGDTGAARPREEPSRHDPLAFGIDASAGIATDFGAVADTPALGATVLARLRVGELLSFGLRGSFFPARASTVPGLPNEGVNIFLAGLAPLACASPFKVPVDLAACAEFEFGYLHAQGFGPPIHPAAHIWWLAPGGGVTAAFPKRGRLRSRFSVDALFPTRRTAFVLLDIGTPHQLPVVAPRAALYLELAFP